MLTSENTEFAEYASENWHTRARFRVFARLAGKRVKEEITNGYYRSYSRYAYSHQECSYS